jgi:calcineurin-like phosphoesterase family protein
MSVWFTSDLHFGHRLVAEVRGFSNTNEHDATLMGEWRGRVRPNDQVWVLGDLAAATPQHALTCVKGLPGVKHLVAGNHDRCHPMHRGAHNWQRRYLEAFQSVQPFARRRIAGLEVLMSHFPYHVDRGEPRHTQYRLRDQGTWLLHGHLHSAERVTSRREIHVGVDAWGMAPVSLDEVAALMAV